MTNGGGPYLSSVSSPTKRLIEPCSSSSAGFRRRTLMYDAFLTTSKPCSCDNSSSRGLAGCSFRCRTYSCSPVQSVFQIQSAETRSTEAGMPGNCPRVVDVGLASPMPSCSNC
eukprot:CAMPEP_0181482912 /NCGR_PEP_ID=MMETSP1110-20121109/45128_1 /TAXON_ID=174948 /ORGANISM="Symbiodinium sp., Strain CCMP421" /LENGTH=112 /DNA_ID=CAMNT_0023608563 /DNA_START=285 /DNA_END=623 /DNA_ORIENTATION=+